MQKIQSNNVNFYYGENHALRDISLSMKENTVTALIGPSGCGKSTYLRLLNRMNDLIDGTKMTGSVIIDGVDIYGKNTNVDALRKT
jgi:phosphate transport system ATP-binding protein